MNSDHAIPASNKAAPASEARARPFDGGDCVGLVPYKTSGNSTNFDQLISFGPSLVAERRINRLKKAVWASGHLHGLAEKGFRPAQCWFVTLTYAPGVDWSPKDISESIRRYRSWCKQVGVPCRYTWVAELQQRGAVHYHLLAWLPQGRRMPQWDRSYSTKTRFWSHGMTNTQKALGGVGYLMKYLSKLGELTRFPKGLRLYGMGGLDESGRDVRRWLNLPEWVKRSFGCGQIKRAKTGLVELATGEILAPAYRCCLVTGGMVLNKLREIPDRFHSGAYSVFPRTAVN